MKLLAIDTSGFALSGAILDDDRPVGSFASATGKNHSLELLPLLAELLRRQGLRLADMDAFAVTVGPGSFTGLRIGLATVKAWCQALDKPLAAVSSLDAMAAATGYAGYAAPIFDARRNEVYTALYQGGRRLSPDRAASPQQLAAELAALGQPVCMAGDGVQSCGELFRQALGERFVLPADGNTLFMAEAAARLGRDKLLRGETADAASLTPVYLRLSEAEEKRLEAEKNGR